MADIVKQILARPIQLADQVTKGADEAHSFKQDCQELKAKTEKLAGLLRQAARASNDLYERPTRRIIDDTEQVLEKALQLVIKCRANGLMKRVFTIIPAAAFRKTSMQLENSLGDVQWLLRVSASADDRDDEYLGLPPIAANEPILCLIWEQIAILYTGSLDDRSDAAASLVSLARDNDRYGKLIIEEGGVPPLLKLAKEGKMEGQENAARAIGLLGRDPESVEQIVNAGVCSVFAKILKEGHMKVQTVVAWAVSELAANHPPCQDHFAQNNIIRFLVSHLAFETVQEHSRYAIASKHGMSIHSVVMANNTPNLNPNDHKRDPDDETMTRIAHPMGNQVPNQMQNVVSNTMALRTQIPSQSKPTQQNQNQAMTQSTSYDNANQMKGTAHNNAKPHQQNQQTHISLSGTSIKGREFEDSETKVQMKAMAARALWRLSEGNVPICSSITESRALLCFAVLLEKGPDDVQSYSAMALMEITAVAEEHAELRRNAFKPTSPAAKAVVDRLIKVIEKADSDLLIPCVKAIGNLARTFRATETRIIGPLVKLLDEREPEVSMEATIALNKFACMENFLHVNHCKAIISAGGAKHLIQLVYFGEQMIQIPALVLLCYISLHVPDSETLAQEEVLIVLEWSTKQAHLIEDSLIDSLLPEAKSRLELYQSRGSRGFH
ncbi:Arm domain-containing protein [Cephalotus follicularis]|uniref:Arm domain-containing protein n=1 Tax=Cephalotus follicularis TaxID=3775 RepID=A0A1Q3CVL1_CEPFO|nr:Arm domain-containing protein [Cephalotus follicularis]